MEGKSLSNIYIASLIAALQDAFQSGFNQCIRRELPNDEINNAILEYQQGGDGGNESDNAPQCDIAYAIFSDASRQALHLLDFLFHLLEA